MHPDLKGVWEHMVEQAKGALAHANRHSCYSDPETPWWEVQAVLQAAHAGELFLKARIAQEHPLLIFDQIPKPQAGGTDLLDVGDLFERGKTVQWSELPARLWATTGIRLANQDVFVAFGKLRNTIQHFAVPGGRDLSGETIDFVFKVLDPFINECWGLCAIDYDEDSSPYEYLTDALVSRELLFCVSPEAASAVCMWSVDWDGMPPAYREELVRRVDAARPNDESTPKPGFMDSFARRDREMWEQIKNSTFVRSPDTRKPGRPA